MSSRHSIAPIPPDTAKAARAILGQNNFYLRVGDNWGPLLATMQQNGNGHYAASPSLAPPTLALGTILQYKEKLSDRQAEEASRLRVDWKYALHQSMHYPGISRAALCQYRQRLYHDTLQYQDFQFILELSNQIGFFQERQEPSITAAEVLNEVCSWSRLEEVILAFKRALEALATNHPKWLRYNILPPWYTRYQFFKTSPNLPQSVIQQDALAQSIGADILDLFKTIAGSDQPELSELEEIKALQLTWLEQFEPAPDGGVQRLARCSFCGSLTTGGNKGA